MTDSLAPLAIVTGAPGWLGTTLVRSLVKGLPEVEALAAPSSRVVRCLVLRGADATELRAISPNLEIVEGDVTDAASLAPLFAGAGGATVFHARGSSTPPRASASSRAST
jgi:nucleoside-diphosphate-sugar epimerase